MLNKKKIKITTADGTVKIKPWVSNHQDDKKHLQEAKNAYAGAIQDGVSIIIFE